MSLVYKIHLSEKLSIKQLNDILDKLNVYLKTLGTSLHDFNIEIDEDNKMIISSGDSESIFKLEDSYDYLSGYIRFENGGREIFIQNSLDKRFISTLEKAKVKVLDVYMQEGQLIKDENFVSIPD
ncbi:MAG: hypothetical protein Q9M91_07260 [Candidatus Dojkabacteria bacterium]|nr:hypothetical protein [Candidatus Dojkabacteria bacterium]